MDDSNNSSNRILGIDPGLNITGYGVLTAHGSRLDIVEAGIIRGGKSRSLEDRLKSLFDGLNDVVESLKPDVVAIEELYSHYERPRTAILMGHARGVLCLSAANAGIPVHHYPATQIKRMLTGNGRAPKSQIQLAVTRFLKLDQTPDPPDVADALAIALCHHFFSGQIATTIES